MSLKAPVNNAEHQCFLPLLESFLKYCRNKEDQESLGLIQSLKDSRFICMVSFSAQVPDLLHSEITCIVFVLSVHFHSVYRIYSLWKHTPANVSLCVCMYSMLTICMHSHWECNRVRVFVRVQPCCEQPISVKALASGL